MTNFNIVLISPLNEKVISYSPIVFYKQARDIYITHDNKKTMMQYLLTKYKRLKHCYEINLTSIHKY